jgi:hypothetical protein
LPMVVRPLHLCAYGNPECGKLWRECDFWKSFEPIVGQVVKECLERSHHPLDDPYRLVLQAAAM